MHSPPSLDEAHQRYDFEDAACGVVGGREGTGANGRDRDDSSLSSDGLGRECIIIMMNGDILTGGDQNAKMNECVNE